MGKGLIKAIIYAAKNSHVTHGLSLTGDNKKEHSLIILLASYLPAQYAMALLKRMSTDVRLLWNNHRHYGIAEALISPDSVVMVSKSSNKLKSWYRRFPIGRGYPYGCAMESAFRLINLSLMIQLLRKSKSEYVLDLIRKESLFILKNLEIQAANNHYLLNIVGLIIAETLIEDLRKKIQFIVDPFIELENILKAQFLPDGGNFEASTGYHFLAVEALAVAALINQRAAETISAKAPWLSKAILLMKTVLDAQGNILKIGDDDDSSCFWPIGTRRLREFQYYFCKFAFADSETDSTDVFFPQFGLASKRCGNARIFFYGTRNGQNGKGGHAHNDKLSISLWLDDEPIFLDSGTYSYVQERNAFRSVKAHSSIWVSGIEPCNLDQGSFYLPDNALCQIQEKKLGLWSGSFHYGEKENLTISRQIAVTDGRVCGVDLVAGRPSEYKLHSQFILSPEVKIISQDLNCLMMASGSRQAWLRSSVPMKIETQETSPCYGKKRSSSKALFEWPADCDQMEWEISWL